MSAHSNDLKGPIQLETFLVELRLEKPHDSLLKVPCTKKAQKSPVMTKWNIKWFFKPKLKQIYSIELGPPVLCLVSLPSTQAS